MIGNKKKFTLGAFYAAIGITFSMQAYRTYPLQDGGVIGPGYFPFYLGILLAVIGACLAFRSLRIFGEQRWELRISWPVIIPVFGAIAVFALLLKSVGLFFSVWAMVFVASMANHTFTLIGGLALGGVVAALCQLIFIWGLGIQVTW